MVTDIAEYDPELAEQEQPQEIVARTAEVCRTESIGRTLDAAYAKASLLELTQEEATALAADFPDEAFRLGAGGNDDLLYIEHAYLRKRLNEVLGVGSATPIRRREWTEEFHYWKKNWQTKQEEKRKAIRLYADVVLIVRGCVVGEAVGDGTYYPDNAQTNYSDALESAMSNAFRRCCKQFGVGLQVWLKGWVEGWKQRNPGGKPKPAAAKAPPTKEPASVGQPFGLPPDWPDTEIHNLKLWIDSFRTNEQYKVALGMMLNEPTLAGDLADWSVVLPHFAATYKAKAKEVATKELTAVIKAALDKLELEKQAEAMINQDTEEMEAEIAIPQE